MKINTTLIALVLTIWFVLLPSAVSAVEEHVDPSDVAELYSGVSLLHYYSASLDLVIQKNPDATLDFLSVMPFAHVQPAITPHSQEFAHSAISIAQVLPELDKLLVKRDGFIADARMTEAAETSFQISADIKTALEHVDSLQAAAVLTGNVLNVNAAPVEGDLVITYYDVLRKIASIRAMLILVQNMVLDQNSNIADSVGTVTLTVGSGIVTGTGTMFTAAMVGGGLYVGSATYSITGFTDATHLTINPVAATAATSSVFTILLPTSLTLSITPESAFVGDTIRFEAMLTHNGIPLPGKKVTLFLDGTLFVTAVTGADGQCSGELTLPYWYISQVEARALYTPQGGDVGVFLASLSPATTINLSFYNLSLTGSAEEGHPGLSTTIKATLDYGTSPPLKNRRFSLYLDNSLIREMTSETDFSEMFVIAADTTIGPHLITISSPSDQRYAPAMTSFSININKVPITLELDKPAVVFIPGSIKLSGNASTELGPLNGAKITITSGSAKTTVTTASDGSFKVTMKTTPGFYLIASQPISIQVTPSEPWNAPLSEIQNLFAVYYLNCILIAVTIAFFGVYLPRRLGARDRSPGRTAEQIPGDIRVALPLTESVTSHDEQPLQITPRKPAQEQILYWYAKVLKFIQKLAGLAPRPEQTMREFAEQTRTVSLLGPVSRYFNEMTLLTERFIYSPNKPTESDVEKSRELAQSINTEVENETI